MAEHAPKAAGVQAAYVVLPILFIIIELLRLPRVPRAVSRVAFGVILVWLVHELAPIP